MTRHLCCRYYCLLREDATLVYGRSTAELRDAPKGVIALTHVTIELHEDEMAASGRLVFTLGTPLRSFVLCAPHQVCLNHIDGGQGGGGRVLPLLEWCRRRRVPDDGPALPLPLLARARASDRARRATSVRRARAARRVRRRRFVLSHHRQHPFWRSAPQIDVDLKIRAGTFHHSTS